MSTTSNILVEMRGVKLKFSDKVILDGVDISVREHEVLVILGMSGGGKSTILNLLMGLIKPDEGDPNPSIRI